MSTTKITENFVNRIVHHHLLLSGIFPNVQVGGYLNQTNIEVKWSIGLSSKLRMVSYLLMEINFGRTLIFIITRALEYEIQQNCLAIQQSE